MSLLSFRKSKKEQPVPDQAQANSYKAAEQSGRLLHLTFEQACPVFASCLEVRMSLQRHDKVNFDKEFFDHLPHLLAHKYAKEHKIKQKQCHSIALQKDSNETFDKQSPGSKMSLLLTNLNVTICKNPNQTPDQYFHSDKKPLPSVRKHYMEHMSQLCLDGRYDLNRPPVVVVVDEPVEEKKDYSSLFEWPIKKKTPGQKGAQITLDFLSTTAISDAMQELAWPDGYIENYIKDMKPAVEATRRKLDYNKTA